MALERGGGNERIRQPELELASNPAGALSDGTTHRA